MIASLYYRAISSSAARVLKQPSGGQKLKLRETVKDQMNYVQSSQASLSSQKAPCGSMPFSRDLCAWQMPAIKNTCAAMAERPFRTARVEKMSRKNMSSARRSTPHIPRECRRWSHVLLNELKRWDICARHSSSHRNHRGMAHARHDDGLRAHPVPHSMGLKMICVAHSMSLICFLGGSIYNIPPMPFSHSMGPDLIG